MYIGEDLFDNYYVVLDYDNKKIGLAGFTTVVEKPSDSFPLWAIILIVVGGIALIGAAIGIFVCIRRRK